MKYLEQKVIKFIDENNLIEKNDKILVALSGGPDSVFLLNFLIKYKRKFKIDLGALHINHKIRGRRAKEDEIFCRELTAQFNIPYYSVERDVKAFAVKNKISIEEAGRIIRYNELNIVQKKYNYTKIATAHNCSDNSETVFLNLIKGTGLSGLAGIPVRRGNIIRPILISTKQEILDYLNLNRIKYRIDETNISSNYERNYIRNEIIPLIKSRLNPRLEEALLKSSELFRNYLSYISKKVNSASGKIGTFSESRIEISIKNLKKEAKELWGDLIRTIIERNFSIQVTFNDCKKIISLLNKEAGKVVKLSSGLNASREKGNLIINKTKEEKTFPSIFIRAGEKKNIDGKILEVKSSVLFSVKKSLSIKYSRSKLREFISADNLDEYFVIRKWVAGDKFIPLGMKGTKKISDFLNEQKIPISQKKNQLVLTNNEKIVWVLGLRLDDRFKVTNETEKVFQLCLK